LAAALLRTLVRDLADINDIDHDDDDGDDGGDDNEVAFGQLPTGDVDALMVLAHSRAPLPQLEARAHRRDVVM
jgi:hypothetical protein